MFNNINRIKIIFLLVPIFLSGCVGLPRSGPTAMDIALVNKNEDNNNQKNTFQIIELNSSLLEKVNDHTSKDLSLLFPNESRDAMPTKLGIGDQLLVHIWEASSDGLFATSENKYTTIETMIDNKGMIFIPYVGRLLVLHKDIEEVRQMITDGLSKKAIEPQVDVNLTSNKSNLVTVLGDVNKSGQLPISIGGLRLSQALALSGGAKASTFDTELTIVRKNMLHAIRLDEVLKNNNNDINLISKDMIIVNHLPKTFTAFGAVNTNNHVKFEREKLYLSEGLAQVGGLNDRLADAGGVFLFRFEPDAKYKNMGLGLSPASYYEKGVATIYRINFKHPDAFFITSSFEMKDKDIIYVANAPVAEFNKFISMIVSPILASSRGIINN